MSIGRIEVVAVQRGVGGVRDIDAVRTGVPWPLACSQHAHEI